MKQTLTPEQKNRIYMYSAGGMIFLLFLALTVLGLVMTLRQSRDIERLSAISILRADLFFFYKEFNIFPQSVIVKKEAKNDKECQANLCLDDYPVDPKTGVRFAYVPCMDVESTNCQAGIADAKGYVITYSLESKSSLVQPGAHRATASSLLGN